MFSIDKYVQYSILTYGNGTKMNIELHGFLQNTAQTIKEKIWSGLISNLSRDDAMDCAVTIVRSETSGQNGRKNSFFRVYSDKDLDFEFVAELLRQIVSTQMIVECVPLKKCIQL